MSDKITVLNVADHPLWCVGIASVINAQRDMLLEAQPFTGRQAIEYFRKHKADVILTELRLPDKGGIELTIAKVAASGKPSGRKNQSDPESEETTWQA
jgi:DNA-binding NarL/FixJ family response regulator